MNGARLILECLKKENVNTIFGYPGGAVIPLYDALYDFKDDFLHIRTSHEQGLVHAADGYARSTGKVGVCFVTSGPGATNAITGIATAYMDSTPLIIISGQVPTSLLGKDSFQEVDITGSTLSITKHNYLIRDVEDIPKVIKEAFLLSNSSRKGPVLIDIPKDIFLAESKFTLDDYKPFEYNIDNSIDNREIEKAIELISKAKKPMIYAGGGIKSCNAEYLLQEFAEKIDTPVVNTLTGLSSIDRSSQLSLGLGGMHGSKEVNLALTNCDLLIGIGARFSDRVIGKSSEFVKEAATIHIDIDKTEINKNIKADVKLIGDLRTSLKTLTHKSPHKNHNLWKTEINNYKFNSKISEDEFHPYNIIKLFNEKLGENTIVTTDVGQHQMWTAKYWDFACGKNFITSAGLGTMGFGLGAAIGAKIGNPDKNVILITGDGSFRMNCNELATISHYNIPITIVMLNNNSLGMVRQWQKLFSNERYSETDIASNIDYIKLASAYSIDGHVCDNIRDLKKILDNISFNKTIFIQCNIDKDYDVYPIVPPNEKLENLICN